MYEFKITKKERKKEKNMFSEIGDPMCHNCNAMRSFPFSRHVI